MIELKLLYYPGCTLKSTASNLEKSAIAIAKHLGIEMKEMKKWYCCGTVYSLTTDNLMKHISCIRNFIKAQEEGFNEIVTICSMCYNTMRQVKKLLDKDDEKRKTINEFMDTENDYTGKVKILHFLDVLKIYVGLARIHKKVVKPLYNLKVTPYYGCLLTRPLDVAIDDAEYPLILHEILSSLDAEIVKTPMKIECCGSYNTITHPEIVAMKTYQIINSVRERGGETIVTSCPLCFFNLDRRQKEVKKMHSRFKEMPIFYFTQLMSLAFGLGAESCDFEKHYIDPIPLLKSKKLLEG